MIRFDVGKKTFTANAYKWRETERKNENNNEKSKWLSWVRHYNQRSERRKKKLKEKCERALVPSPESWFFFFHILISILMSTHPNNPTRFRYWCWLVWTKKFIFNIGTISPINEHHTFSVRQKCYCFSTWGLNEKQKNRVAHKMMLFLISEERKPNQKQINGSNNMTTDCRNP